MKEKTYSIFLKNSNNLEKERKKGNVRACQQLLDINTYYPKVLRKVAVCMAGRENSLWREVTSAHEVWLKMVIVEQTNSDC